jgi:hypothetical protein
MPTCNRLDLQTLGSPPIMPKNLPDHGLRLVCMFDKFHVTCNPKSKVSRDVFKNKIECQLTSTFYSKMSPQYLAYTIF